MSQDDKNERLTVRDLVIAMLDIYGVKFTDDNSRTVAIVSWVQQFNAAPSADLPQERRVLGDVLKERFAAEQAAASSALPSNGAIAHTYGKLKAALAELLRLYDWRNDLGRIERDFNHDKKKMTTWLNKYGREKHAAWDVARTTLAGAPDIDAMLLHERIQTEAQELVAPNSATSPTNPYKQAWDEWRSLHTGDARKMMDNALRYLWLRKISNARDAERLLTNYCDEALDDAIDERLARSEGRGA